MSARWMLVAGVALGLIGMGIGWALWNPLPERATPPGAGAAQVPSTPGHLANSAPGEAPTSVQVVPTQGPSRAEPPKPDSAQPSLLKESNPSAQPKDPWALYTDEDAVREQEQTYGDIWSRKVPVPPEAQGAKRLTPDNGVWIDLKRRRVIVAGRVVLRRGMLEMFACPKFTKEHESIVGVNTKAYVVHAALLALGVEPGRPVSFDPKYRPAEGPEIRVLVCWDGPDGKRLCVPAQKWIRHVQTGQEMQHPWIFTGSQWWESPDKKERFYMAEQGDFICVSNFPTAMLDLPIRSSNSNAELLFEAYTQRIPPVGTDVALILEPVASKKRNSPAGSADNAAAPMSPKPQNP